MYMYLYRVVPETADDFVVVVLQAVNPFAALTATLYPLQSVLSSLPVCINTLRYIRRHIRLSAMGKLQEALQSSY